AAQAPTVQAAPGVVIKKEAKLVLVDVVVTDKKGNYVHDLEQKDFKVYEDNKEQSVSSFNAAAEGNPQAPGQRRYLILFFDNSTMQAPDQIQARNAAKQFIDANASPDHVMAVVDFGGALRIVQNFTANADVLRAAVSGVKNSSVDPNAPSSSALVASNSLSPGIFSLGAEAEFGARSMLLAVRTLAKNLRSVPGRKMVVLFSGGFPLTPETQSELTATIDACNKANVAIYALDSRGLVAQIPSARLAGHAGRGRAVASRGSQPTATRAKLLLVGYPQRPGGGGGAPGGGGAGGGGGRPGGGGAGGGGTGGGGGRPGGGTGGTGGTGGGGKPGGGTGGTGGTGRGPTGGNGGTTGRPGGNPNNIYGNNVFTQPRTIIPQLPPSVSTNQQVLAALAEGTGGFTIFNTNDLLGGLAKIGREQSEFYVLGYAPPESPEGSCHTLKVKVDRGGINIRSRSGYCNAKSENPLEGKPLEKQLEARATAADAGSIHGALEAPYFYTAPNVARVNLAMEIPPDSLKFDKEKGKYRADVNVLGIAYRADGSIGAKFSDTVNLELEKDEWKEFQKTPYHYENQFDAAPGEYKLTVVLSGGGDAYGKFETPLKIDSYDGKHFSLAGVAISNSTQHVGEGDTSIDAALLEDHTPLVVKGTQITPSGANHFKKTDNVVLYTEVYEPLLTSEKPPVVAAGYRILDRATQKDVFSTGAIRLDEFIQKGNPVIPIALVVKVKDLNPGAYTLLVQAVDAAGNHAPNRTVDFDVTN
ncbi:MAG TPA: VWA domain-containing protein, partial [Candidatus Acidoferrales bacterium]|nr:VWA domain-containing protein [Candidatus Acidoferrales bacterium]